MCTTRCWRRIYACVFCGLLDSPALDWYHYGQTHCDAVYPEGHRDDFYRQPEWWKPYGQTEGKSIHELVRDACGLCEIIHEAYIVDFDPDEITVPQQFLINLNTLIVEYQGIYEDDIRDRLVMRIREAVGAIEKYETHVTSHL